MHKRSAQSFQKLQEGSLEKEIFVSHSYKDFALSAFGNLYQTNEETIYGSSSDGDGTPPFALFYSTYNTTLCPPQLNKHGVCGLFNIGDVLTVCEYSRMQIKKCHVG